MDIFVGHLQMRSEDAFWDLTIAIQRNFGNACRNIGTNFALHSTLVKGLTLNIVKELCVSKVYELQAPSIRIA